eukprot:211915-Pelagomonas_calceolata.AAC.4
MGTSHIHFEAGHQPTACVDCGQAPKTTTTWDALDFWAYFICRVSSLELLCGRAQFKCPVHSHTVMLLLHTCTACNTSPAASLLQCRVSACAPASFPFFLWTG